MIERDDIMSLLEEALVTRGEMVVPAYGFSMGRRWRNGKLLIRSGRKDAGLGSVVVFHRDQRWYAHRIVWIHGHGEKRVFVTKGDAVRTLDRPFLPENDVLGVVLAIFDESGGEKRVNSLFMRFRGLLRALC